MIKEYTNTIYLSIITVLSVVLIYYIQKTPEECLMKLHSIPFFTKRTNKKYGNVVNDVPLVIYQSWHSNKVPPKMKQFIDTLVGLNPEFDHFLYSDEACADFIDKHFDKEVVKAFHLLKPGAYKSDLWRYCILYKNGGVYLDIKFITLKPLLYIVNEYPILFVKDRDNTCAESSSLHGLYNGFMISPPNNEIFKYCIADIVNSCKFRLYKSADISVTGPCLLQEMIDEHTSGYISPYKYAEIEGKNQPVIHDGKDIVCISYIDYRNEQKYSQKSEHYAVLWDKGDIYN